MSSCRQRAAGRSKINHTISSCRQRAAGTSQMKRVRYSTPWAAGRCAVLCFCNSLDITIAQHHAVLEPTRTLSRFRGVAASRLLFIVCICWDFVDSWSVPWEALFPPTDKWKLTDTASALGPIVLWTNCCSWNWFCYHIGVGPVSSDIGRFTLDLPAARCRQLDIGWFILDLPAARCRQLDIGYLLVLN